MGVLIIPRERQTSSQFRGDIPKTFRVSSANGLSVEMFLMVTEPKRNLPHSGVANTRHVINVVEPGGRLPLVAVAQ